MLEGFFGFVLSDPRANSPTENLQIRARSTSVLQSGGYFESHLTHESVHEVQCCFPGYSSYQLPPRTNHHFLFKMISEKEKRECE